MASKSRAPIELFESRLDVALKALCHPILSWYREENTWSLLKAPLVQIFSCSC